MIIYFLRHGETDWNREMKLQGSVDIPLNENGREVARWTREGLKEVPFDAAFSSPLSRAKETAQIILEGRNIEIQEDARLKEVNFGVYEGIVKSEADENLFHFFKESEKYHPKGDGESIEQLYARVGAFLEELFQNPELKDSTILVTTHGAALSGIIAVMKGYSVGELWKDGLHKNCGATVVEVKDGQWKIQKQAVIFYDAETR